MIKTFNSNPRYYILLIVLFMSVELVLGQRNTDNILLILSKTETEITHDNQVLSQMLARHQQRLNKFLGNGSLIKVGVINSGGAIFITDKPSFNEILTSLNTDPLFTNDYFMLEAMAFKKTHGTVCGFIEDCKKAAFQLVFFWPNLNKETIRIASDMEYQHQLFLKQNFLETERLLSGKFQDRDGNFIITNQAATASIVINDPAVSQDYFVPQIIYFTGCILEDCR